MNENYTSILKRKAKYELIISFVLFILLINAIFFYESLIPESSVKILWIVGVPLVPLIWFSIQLNNLSLIKFYNNEFVRQPYIILYSGSNKDTYKYSDISKILETPYGLDIYIGSSKRLKVDFRKISFLNSVTDEILSRDDVKRIFLNKELKKSSVHLIRAEHSFDNRFLKKAMFFLLLFGMLFLTLYVSILNNEGVTLFFLLPQPNMCS